MLNFIRKHQVRFVIAGCITLIICVVTGFAHFLINDFKQSTLAERNRLIAERVRAISIVSTGTATVIDKKWAKEFEHGRRGSILSSFDKLWFVIEYGGGERYGDWFFGETAKKLALNKVGETLRISLGDTTLQGGKSTFDFLRISR